jgi:hypothetical protein
VEEVWEDLIISQKQVATMVIGKIEGEKHDITIL